MFTIIQAKNKESQKIRFLEKQVWGEYVTSQYDIAFYVRFGYVYVAKKGGRIVGAIVAMKTRDDEIKIVDWVVLFRFRRLGLGKKLYVKLEQETEDLPLVAFVKKDNVASSRAHTSLGFKKVSTIRDPFGTDGGNWNVMKKAKAFSS